MNECKKALTLKENHVFSKLYAKGKCYRSQSVVVYVLKNHRERQTKYGITVSKKRGKAVIRNRMRRKIREAYRLLYPYIRKGYNIVIVARQQCENNSSASIKNELHDIFVKACLICEDKGPDSAALND